MITADKIVINETTNVVISAWVGNSGTVGEGEEDVVIEPKA